MSRFKIIVFIVLGIAIVVVPLILQYVLSFRSVSFVVDGNIETTLYKTVSGKKEPLSETIKSTKSIQLQKGEYCATPTDKKYDLAPICFTVDNKDVSVVINPAYSDSYLAELLLDEIAEINIIINKEYSAVINDFVLKNGLLYGRGEWYGATLTQKVARNDQGDVYRVLLKKVEGSWEVVAYPQIVLSKFDYPDVPRDVLSDVNLLVGIQGL